MYLRGGIGASAGLRATESPIVDWPNGSVGPCGAVTRASDASKEVSFWANKYKTKFSEDPTVFSVYG